MALGLVVCALSTACTSGSRAEEAHAPPPATRASALTAVPGRIEAEAYNPGGEGVGYHTGRGDWGTAHPRTDSMDILADSTASGGYSIGWIEPGQWFAYDVSVGTAGTYTVSPRVNAPWGPSQLHVEVDGVNVTGSMSAPGNNPAWISQTSARFSLSAGTHTLKVYMETNSFGFDALDVTLVQPAPTGTTFLRGINFGGGYASAVTVGGRAFVSEADAKTGGLTVTTTQGAAPNAWQTTIAHSAFVPAVTEAGLGTLLNSHLSASNSGLKLTQAACNGTYQVSTYHLENNASNWRSFTLKVQGQTYGTVSLAQNNWKKFGPYTATVANATNGCNGTLTVELVQGVNDASIFGMEISTTNGGKLPDIGSSGGGTPGCGQASTYIPAGYVPTFCDEFNGTALDRTRWKTRYIYSNETLDRLNNEQQRYRDNNNHLVANGTLKLMAYKVTSNDPWGINYESGMIRSVHTQKYGYFEARVKFPGGVGVWPAFWLNPDYGTGGELLWPPEIDILEYVVNGREDTVDMVHTGVIVNHGGGNYEAVRDGRFLYNDPNFHTDWTYYRNPGGSLANQWHTFGLEWDATTATTYLNGRKLVTRGYKWKHDDGRDAPPAHILLNLAIGGDWAGRYGIDDSKFPQAFEIDYVRAYRKP
jgi:beta-glucanase (GH16 family)